MYIPSSNAENRPEVMHDFIGAHPLGALVTMSTEGLFATHLPFVLDTARGSQGVLEGHLARANPHHRQTLTDSEVLVIFQGPDAYVTPAWYPSKAEHGKVVPTWNYVAVHVYGHIRFTDDSAFLRRHLETLTAQSERNRKTSWTLADAPAAFLSGLEKAIIGLEIEITRLEGKWKMSQNRTATDIDGVVRGLADSMNPTDRLVSRIVQERRPPPGR